MTAISIATPAIYNQIENLRITRSGIFAIATSSSIATTIRVICRTTTSRSAPLALYNTRLPKLARISSSDSKTGSSRNASMMRRVYETESESSAWFMISPAGRHP